MTELIFDRIEHDLDGKDQFKKVPETLLRRNKRLFSKLLIEHPKMQKFYTDFSEQLQKIIETEILSNSDSIGLFMMHPHKKNAKLSSRNFDNSVLIMKPEDLDDGLIKVDTDPTTVDLRS